MYTTITASGVIIAIAKKTDVEGYTRSILECVLLSDEEMSVMTEDEIDKWINESNDLMEKVCDLMNNNLKK